MAVRCVRYKTRRRTCASSIRTSSVPKNMRSVPLPGIGIKDEPMRQGKENGLFVSGQWINDGGGISEVSIISTIFATKSVLDYFGGTREC